MTIYQRPNASIIIAAVAWLVGTCAPAPFSIVGNVVFTIAIIIWAYEEAVHGVNWFRTAMGCVVLLLIALSLFMQFK